MNYVVELVDVAGRVTVLPCRDKAHAQALARSMGKDGCYRSARVLECE